MAKWQTKIADIDVEFDIQIGPHNFVGLISADGKSASISGGCVPAGISGKRLQGVTVLDGHSAKVDATISDDGLTMMGKVSFNWFTSFSFTATQAA